VIGSVLESYLIGVGNLRLDTWDGLISGCILFVSGMVLSLPGSIIGISNTQMDLLGLMIIGAGIGWIGFMRTVRRKSMA
jgi:ABC-type transport system involved in cytochrome bd biosynthesis fused ATPase/permease subunit